MPDFQIEKINNVLGRMIRYLNKREIALTKADKLMDSGNGRFGKMVSNDTVPKKAFIEKFLQTFPEVDPTWLQDERQDSSNEVIVRESDMVYSSSRPTIEARPFTVMPDPEEFDGSNHKFAYSEEGVIAMRVKVVPAKAQLGYLRGFADPEWFDSFDYEVIPVTKEARGTYLGFETVGWSMVNLTSEQWAQKSIFPSRIAIGRELNRDAWKSKLHIHSNDAWVIVHKTDGILIKEIISHDTETGMITIHSWNPDKAQFPNEVLNLEDVAQLFNVLQVVDKRR